MGQSDPVVPLPPGQPLCEGIDQLLGAGIKRAHSAVQG